MAVKKIIKAVNKQTKKTTGKTAQQKANDKLRKEVSRLASIANKRIDRLLNANIDTSTALEKWKDSGGVKFSVKNKTNRELQKEYWRVKRFIDSNTSTITGAKSTLKKIQKVTGNTKLSSTEFFKLSDKISDYLKTTEGAAEALAYRQIWQLINNYTQQAKVDLTDIDNTVQRIIDLRNSQQIDEREQGNNFKYLVDI